MRNAQGPRISRKPGKRAARRAAPAPRGGSIPPDAGEQDAAPRAGVRRPAVRRTAASNTAVRSTADRGATVRRPADRGPADGGTRDRGTADRRDNSALNLGRTARRLRESQNLTLADVARRANISSAMLSRLETGRVSPSLETIVALAQSLGVTPSVLMQRVGSDDGGAQLIRAGEGLETVRSGTRRGHTYHLLAAQRGPRKVFEPFLVTLNDRSEVFPGFQHPGTEFIHLLTGVLHYRHGRHTYVLRPGDTLTFNGDVAHGPERLERVPIRMLSIIIYGTPDDVP